MEFMARGGRVVLADPFSINGVDRLPLRLRIGRSALGLHNSHKSDLFGGICTAMSYSLLSGPSLVCTSRIFSSRKVQAQSPVSIALLLASLLTPVLATSRSFAQAVFGSIVGTVTDPTGAIIPNATIVVTDVSKGTTQTVQSNSSGNYSVLRLIPDTYTVKATVQGFAPAETDNVVVSADTAPQVNLVFQPQGATQVVNVTSAAPTLQTDSADVANVITQR